MLQLGVLLGLVIGARMAGAQEALDNLQRAAEAGDVEAQYQLGCRLQVEDPSAGWRWIDRAAAAGHDGARIQAAIRIGQGLSLKDPGPTEGPARRARLRELLDGLYEDDANLTSFFATHLAPDDPEAARRLWRTAYAAGSPAAAFALARDVDALADWAAVTTAYESAYNGGVPAAAAELFRIYRNGAGGQSVDKELRRIRGAPIAADPIKAFYWCGVNRFTALAVGRQSETDALAGFARDCEPLAPFLPEAGAQSAAALVGRAVTTARDYRPAQLLPACGK